MSLWWTELGFGEPSPILPNDFLEISICERVTPIIRRICWVINEERNNHFVDDYGAHSQRFCQRNVDANSPSQRWDWRDWTESVLAVQLAVTDHLRNIFPCRSPAWMAFPLRSRQLSLSDFFLHLAMAVMAIWPGSGKPQLWFSLTSSWKIRISHCIWGWINCQ